jgi:UDP-glucuronate 4-epimerase
VINLAGQVGVRYSRINPGAYLQSNVIGFFNILDNCRRVGTPHLLYASSSSVYGGNEQLPYSTRDSVDHPVSLYAATKKSNELFAHVYSYADGLPTTGLRFFTVYGPWGRPDMSYFLFTKAILAGEPIQVFNYGEMERDFTYVDDIVEAIVRLIDQPAQPAADWDPLHPNPATSWTPYRIFNIGNHQPVPLLEFIGILENVIGEKAILNLQPMQVGDVKATFADVEDLHRATGFAPNTSLETGLSQFVGWFRDYYRIK